jgi:hypothetical protein
VIATQGHRLEFAGIVHAAHGEQPHAGKRGMAGDAAEQPRIRQGLDRATAQGFGAVGLRHLCQFLAVSQSHQHLEGGAGQRHVMPAGPFDQLFERLRLDRVVGVIAHDVAQHHRIGDAGHGHATHTCVGIILGKAGEGRLVVGVHGAQRLDADGRVGVIGLRGRAELVEDAHGRSDCAARDLLRFGRAQPLLPDSALVVPGGQPARQACAPGTVVGHTAWRLSSAAGGRRNRACPCASHHLH